MCASLLSGKLEEDGLSAEGSSGVGPRNFKSKLEEALTAKQEMEAKATSLEAKVKQYETENAALKQKVSRVYPSHDTNTGCLVGMRKIEQALMCYDLFGCFDKRTSQAILVVNCR